MKRALVLLVVLLGGGVALQRRRRRAPQVPSPATTPPPPPPPRPESPARSDAPDASIPEAGEGSIHLMMEDGSVVEASEDVDPDGRLRYLADELLASGRDPGSEPPSN